jgi:hypothetical protein
MFPEQRPGALLDSFLASTAVDATSAYQFVDMTVI